MGRLRSKKFSAHGQAAKSSAAKTKPSHAPASGASARASAVAEAAVNAAFDDEQDDAIDDHENDDDDDGDDALSGLSRGQRKRMKRRSAFMRKMGLVQRVVKETEAAKKKATDGAFAEIQELQDSLFLSDKELAARAATKISQATNVAVPTAKPKKLSGKQRQKLAVRELGQLKAVHTHPQFQTDPFAAIQLHLQNTVVQANAATLEKTQAVKTKKTASNANAMDME